MANFDLTRINCQFLDRHLTFPLLEFLCGKEVRKATRRCSAGGCRVTST